MMFQRSAVSVRGRLNASGVPAPQASIHSHVQPRCSFSRIVRCRFGIDDAVRQLVDSEQPETRQLLALVVKAQLQQQKAEREKEELQLQREKEELQLPREKAKAELQLQQVKAELQLQQVKAELERKEWQLERKEWQLQQLTADRLLSTGLLNMRGLVEYAEDILADDSDKRGPRAAKWTAILAKREGLRTCLCTHMRGKSDASSIAARVAQLYSHLPGYTHVGQFQESLTVVDIVEGPLNREQMQMLACIGKEVHVPVQLRYRPPSAATVSDAWTSQAGSSAYEGTSSSTESVQVLYDDMQP